MSVTRDGHGCSADSDGPWFGSARHEPPAPQAAWLWMGSESDPGISDSDRDSDPGISHSDCDPPGRTSRPAAAARCHSG